MNAGLVSILLAGVVCVVAGQNNPIPAGFVAIPPLPIQFNPPTKGTPKPTPKPITKKPNPTKAPFIKPTTKKPILTTTLRPSLPPSISTPTNCQYAINVPKANCNNGNAVMQQALSTLKQDLDKTRQQHQAQNAQVQAKISQLQTQQSGYLNKISDLQNNVKNLVAAFNNINCSPTSTTPPPGVSRVTATPTSSSGSLNPGLQQAVLAVRGDLNQAVKDFNNKLQAINLQMQNASLQNAQVDIQLESQILQQGSDIARMTQEISDLKRQLQQAQASNGTGTGSGATSQDIAKLQARILKISSDIQQYDRTQQAKFNTLNSKANGLDYRVANLTNDIQGLQTRTLLAKSKIGKLDKDVTVVHDSLALFRQSVNPKINKMETDITDLQTKSSNMKKDIDRVGQSTLNILLQTGSDRQKLKGIEAQSSVLQTQVATISAGLNQQQTTIGNISKSVKDLVKSVPTADLTKMNNVILTILNQPGQTPTKQQLTDLKDGIKAIQYALTTNFPANPNPAG